MSRTNNILQFPKNPLHGFHLKAFAVLFYLFVAVMLTYVLQASTGSIGFLILLGVLYHFFLRGRTMNAHYLQQNAFLLLILFLLALFVFPLTLIPTFVIAAIYWLLIGRGSREAPYFIRFHILTAIILNLFILMMFLLLFAANDFLEALLRLMHIPTMVTATIQLYGLFAMWGIFWGVAIWLSLAALMGRTPYIGLVSNSIRHWT